MNKLMIGTATFGLDYGIANKNGKLCEKECMQIVSTALNNDITFFDTAPGYGNSECVLGNLLQRKSNACIVTKAPAGSTAVSLKNSFFASKKTLGVETVYGYLLHRFEDFLENPEIVNSLRELQAEGHLLKYGFSLYYPSQLDLLFEKNIVFDLVQLPFSVFDQRFLPYFKELKRRGVEIHTRSVFLQGLAFLHTEKIPATLAAIKPKIQRLQELVRHEDSSIESLLLSFVNHHPDVDKIIIGVSSHENLLNNINALRVGLLLSTPLFTTLQELAELDEKIIIPVHWQPIQQENNAK